MDLVLILVYYLVLPFTLTILAIMATIFILKLAARIYEYFLADIFRDITFFLTEIGDFIRDKMI